MPKETIGDRLKKPFVHMALSVFAALCGAVFLIVDFTSWHALLELILSANVAVQYLNNYKEEGMNALVNRMIRAAKLEPQLYE
ncbi:MAG: hypothetical protein KGY41_05200, partial [Desulfovermiculus sp.]|nr:hypothetical protein [Desulfovermiculus sp.]